MSGAQVPASDMKGPKEFSQKEDNGMLGKTMPEAVDESNIDIKAERRVKRKIDVRLMPILTLMYTFALIDRTNLGSARIAGLDEATGLKYSNHASIAIMVFYLGYVLFEIPSNIMLKKVGAANWLSFLAGSWGLVTLCMGLTKSWKTLAVCRVLLGSLEAGIFPGCVYLMVSYYRKFELQKSGSSSSKAPLTMGVAILAWFLVLELPENEIKKGKFLSAADAEVVKMRFVQTTGSLEPELVNWATIKSVLRDWRIFSLQFLYMGRVAAIYGLLLFLPLILRHGLGYSQTESYLLAAPPAAAAAVFTFAVSWISDRLRVRSPFVMLEGALAITGLCMIGFLDNSNSRYAGAFLGSCGGNALIVTGAAWVQNNIRGDAKRAVTAAVQVMASGVGGIYSALVFRQQDAPNFVPGLVACVALIGFSLICVAITAPLMVRANRQADRGEKVLEGDPSFRYVW